MAEPHNRYLLLPTSATALPGLPAAVGREPDGQLCRRDRRWAGRIRRFIALRSTPALHLRAKRC